MTEELFVREAADISLYEYQERAIQSLRENILAGFKNQILAAPTGSGKTVCASYLIRECFGKAKRAVFVCDRIPLVEQTSATFDRYGIPHGVIQADHWRYQPWQLIQVASAQTLQRRKWPDDLSLIVVDEAHTLNRATLERIARRDCVTIGLTATPFTKGLGKHYDAVVSVTTTNRLIADGFLAPFRVFAASEPDMEGAKVVAGEWTEAEAASRSMPIVGDCVAEYLKHGNGAKFIAFGVNVAHCEEIQRQMMAAGVQCGLYTYQTGDEERASMIEEFRKPDSYLRGLVSVSALAKGFDVEDVEVIIIARPLRNSLAEHIQILGRGLRRDPKNPEKVCTVLDHSGNVERFWQPMQEFFEVGATELDDGKPKPKPENRERKEPEPIKCPKCAHVHKPAPMCSACGHPYPRRSKIEVIAGELREFTGAVGASADEAAQALYSQLVYIAEERGYQKDWAYHRYVERTGQRPTGLRDDPAKPTPQVRNWVRSRMIAFAKGRAKAKAR